MDLVTFFSIILFVCIGFGGVLIVCELAQRACDHCNDIDKILIQSNWYLLPHEIQRILPIILIVVQTPVRLECFGSIPCSRETFKKASFGPIYLFHYHLIHRLSIITKMIFRLSTRDILTLQFCVILAIEITISYSNHFKYLQLMYFNLEFYNSIQEYYVEEISF